MYAKEETLQTQKLTKLDKFFQVVEIYSTTGVVPSLDLIFRHIDIMYVFLSFPHLIPFIASNPTDTSHYSRFRNRRGLGMAFWFCLCSIYYLLLLVPVRRKHTHDIHTHTHTHTHKQKDTHKWFPGFNGWVTPLLNMVLSPEQVYPRLWNQS